MLNELKITSNDLKYLQLNIFEDIFEGIEGIFK